MNSTLKTAALLLLVVLLVSAVTIITQFSATTTKTVDTSGGTQPEGGGADGPPLALSAGEVHYDPEDLASVANRSFSGFFETGDTTHWVSFWFKNENPFPVKVGMRDRSCSSCPSARVAVVSGDELRRYTARAACAGLPWSPVPLPDLTSAVAFAEMDAKLAWHSFDFEKPDDTFTVPAADAGRPTVCVVALGFKAQTVGQPKAVTAVLYATGRDGRQHPYPLGVVFAPRPAFEVTPLEVQVGDIQEGGPPQTVDVWVYSSTRMPGDLPVPVGRVEGDDPFVTLGKPVALTDAEADMLVRRAKAEVKVNLRMLSGYRFPVTIHRESAGQLADIGKFEKKIDFAVPGTTHTAKATIKGRVTGLVQLDRGDKIELGTYNSGAATKKVAGRVYTTRKDLELEVAPAHCTPLFVQYSLDPPVTEGARKVWPVRVTIPADEGRKPNWDGVAAFRAKTGGAVVNVRIPVTGNGTGR